MVSTPATIIKMKIKIIWMIGILVLIVLVLATFLITKQVYYEKGANDQFVVIVSGLVESALNCEPINIRLDQDRAIQLVNIACSK